MSVNLLGVRVIESRLWERMTKGEMKGERRLIW